MEKGTSSSRKEQLALRKDFLSILDRNRLIGAITMAEDDELLTLLKSIRTFKETNNLESLPLYQTKKGLKSLITKLDKVVSISNPTPEDIQGLKKNVASYLDVSEVPKMEMEESKEEEKAEEKAEEKEEEKEEKKAEPPPSPKKRYVSGTRESPRIRRKPDAPPTSVAPPRPTMSQAVSSPRPPVVPSPRPPIGMSPRMRALQAQVAQAPAPAPAPPTPPPTPTAPQQEPKPEEKPIEDISTQQVVEIPSERKGTDGKVY